MLWNNFCWPYQCVLRLQLWLRHFSSLSLNAETILGEKVLWCSVCGSTLSTCRRDVWQWSGLLHFLIEPPALIWLHWWLEPLLWPARLVACNKERTRNCGCLVFNVHLGCSSMICSISNIFFPASCSKLCIQLVEAALKTGHQTRDLS